MALPVFVDHGEICDSAVEMHARQKLLLIRDARLFIIVVSRSRVFPARNSQHQTRCITASPSRCPWWAEFAAKRPLGESLGLPAAHVPRQLTTPLVSNATEYMAFRNHGLGMGYLATPD